MIEEYTNVIGNPFIDKNINIMYFHSQYRNGKDLWEKHRFDNRINSYIKNEQKTIYMNDFYVNHLSVNLYNQYTRK